MYVHKVLLMKSSDFYRLFVLTAQLSFTDRVSDVKNHNKDRRKIIYDQLTYDLKNLAKARF